MRGDPKQWPETYNPATYARIARKVDLAMWHSSKPCLGGECDLDYPCQRHERTLEVVSRIERWRKHEGV